MKNLTIKRIALGLMLAGYTASGAFAALTATTTNTILGRAPFVNAPSVNPLTPDYTGNKVDITVKRGGTILTATDPWQTGDIVELKYKTVDEDGDQEGTPLGTANSVKFAYLKGTTWTYVSPTTTATGTVTWAIPTAAVGATDIGFAIRPTTEFGLPAVNNWVTGTISGAAAPSDGGNTVNPTDPASPSGPGTTPVAPGVGPIIPSTNSYTIEIYESTVAAGGVITYGTVNLAAAGATVAPQIGKIYAVKVMDTTVTPAVDATATFNYTWTLDGTYGAVNALTTTLPVVAGTTITGVAHELKVNSNYSTTYKAGAQGFSLKVTTN